MNIFNVVMKKSVFFKHTDQIVASSIKVVDNQVSFKTDSITKKYFDDNKIPYKLENNLVKKFTQALYLNITLIISLLIFIMVLYINSFRVSEIKFNGEFVINDKIKNKIEEKYVHFLSFNFIDVDYEKLSKELRLMYPNYEWINAYKDGNNIVVNINNLDDKLKDNVLSDGDIIAKKDGVISTFRVFNGKNLVSNNLYVKKGDVLISGTNEDMSKTEARGQVLAYTYEEITITVDKEVTEIKESSNKYSYKQIILFGKSFSIGKKNKYESYKTNRKLIFNLFNFFKIYKIEEIELYDIINTYDYEKATIVAKNIIENNFNENKTLEEEKIVRLELLNYKEDSDSFTFKFLTKKLESIGEFKSY